MQKIYNLFLLLILTTSSCTPRTKNDNQSWGECRLSIDCNKGFVCKNRRCVKPVVSKTASKTAPKDMIYVPAGEFIMGSSSGSLTERPQITAVTDEFFLDKTEVTVSDYEKCVKRRQCTPVSCKIKRGKNMPITCVTHVQAKRYCFTLGKRLPTEEEWEKAARGTDARRYPWGDTPPDCVKCNFEECKPFGISSVGVRLSGKGPYGAYDQAGNVWEWTSSDLPPWDKTGDPKMKNAGYASRKNKNKFKRTKEKKKYYVIKGGSYEDDARSMRVSAKLLLPEDFYSPALGFRCAKDVK